MIFPARKIFDEREHAAFKIKTVGYRHRAAAVEEIDPHALREICRLAQDGPRSSCR